MSYVPKFTVPALIETHVGFVELLKVSDCSILVLVLDFADAGIDTVEALALFSSCSALGTRISLLSP
jgi:hypothetical protein